MSQATPQFVHYDTLSWLFRAYASTLEAQIEPYARLMRAPRLRRLFLSSQSVAKPSANWLKSPT